MPATPYRLRKQVARLRRIPRIRFARYVVAAGLASAADSLLFVALSLLLDPVLPATFGPGIRIGPTFVALAFSYPFGVWVHYLASLAFVFDAGEAGFQPGQLRRFLWVSAFVFVLNYLLTSLFIYMFPLFARPSQAVQEFTARTLAAMLVGLLSFQLHRRWTFRQAQ